ncbi:hypothetical protein KC845_02860 [Candidatus Kaiserbacteria bacterium]|nr:hypothetical protein [Candidatus Kaiserbacteria bacterium]
MNDFFSELNFVNVIVIWAFLWLVLDSVLENEHPLVNASRWLVADLVAFCVLTPVAEHYGIEVAVEGKVNLAWSIFYSLIIFGLTESFHRQEKVLDEERRERRRRRSSS